MPRNVIWQRLNRHPKHRWDMLRNMAISLFTHERITTTYAKAKCLIPVVNKIFSLAVRNTDKAHSKVYGILFSNAILRDKIFNFYADKYKQNKGGITRLVKINTRRKGDNAQMAIVELLDNKYTVSEEVKFDHIHNKSNLNFSEWEMFTRKTQLESLHREKEARDKIYNSIKNKVIEFKHINPDASKKEIHRLLRREFFGNEVQVSRLRTDWLIPHNHMFQLFLKGVSNLNELESYYRKSSSLLDYEIRKCKEQIKILEDCMTNKKKSKTYEKNNFTKYYSLYKEYEEEYENTLKETATIKETKERSDIIRYNIDKKLEEKQAELQKIVRIQEVDQYAKKKGYDPFNLSPEQEKDLEEFRLNMKKVRQAMDFVGREDYEPIRELKKPVYHMNYKNGYIPPEMAEDVLNDELLLELKSLELKDMKDIVKEEEMKTFLEKEQTQKEQKQLEADRKELLKVFKHRTDNQVKKKNRLFTNLTIEDIKNTKNVKEMLDKVKHASRI